tara:strand:- start:635 stop:817 length:183 start_codon:yes stop_codon:yes gene_type:complete
LGRRLLFSTKFSWFFDTQNNSSFSKNEIETFSFNSNISFLGHIDKIKDAYEESDIVVLPS